jgi:DNA-binding IclR family transcriptional regulator
MTYAIDDRALAAHVLITLAADRGRAARLDELADDLGVRRADVRRVVSALHAQGMLDAARLRLTMPGLALAAALQGCKLRDVRRPVVAERTAVAA